MKRDFQADADRILAQVAWTEQDRRRVRSLAMDARPARRLPRRALAIALALALLSVGALAAVLLRYGPMATVQQVAGQALHEKYGLTAQTLGLFYPDIRQQAGEWTVDYRPEGYAPALLGSYRVVVKDGKALSATWSYDGTDLAALEQKDLRAPIWGQRQMEMALKHPELASAISAPQYGQAMDERMPVTPPPGLQRDQVMWQGEILTRTTPGAEDMPEAEAFALGKQALMEIYGLTEQDLSGASSMEAEGVVPFYRRQDGRTMWSFSLVLVKDGMDMGLGVAVDARTGEILSTSMVTGGGNG